MGAPRTGCHGARVALSSSVAETKKMRGISAALDTSQMQWGTAEPREKWESSDFKIVI